MLSDSSDHESSTAKKQEVAQAFGAAPSISAPQVRSSISPSVQQGELSNATPARSWKPGDPVTVMPDLKPSQRDSSPK
jgi:hypothetical protein